MKEDLEKKMQTSTELIRDRRNTEVEAFRAASASARLTDKNREEEEFVIDSILFI